MAGSAATGRSGLCVRTAAELVSLSPAQAPYVVEGLAVRGAITDLTAKPKVGKTTFALCMARAVVRGQPFLARDTSRGRVLYLTEERSPTVQAELERLGLTSSSDVYLSMRHEAWKMKWPEIARAAKDVLPEIGAVLLVVDTFSDWAGLTGDSENSSGVAMEAMRPLQDIAAAGIAVLMLRHDKKGASGEVGDAGRGSNAFQGAADIVATLRRVPGRGHENRRTLEAVGRFDAIPPRLLIEWQGGDYVCLGDRGSVEREDARAALLAALPRSEDRAATEKDLLAALGGDTARSTLQRVLKEMEAGGYLGKAKGKGTAGSRAYGYWIAAEDVPARNELPAL